MTQEVFDGGTQEFRAVAEVTDAVIAFGAKEGPNFPGLMVMVNTQTPNLLAAIAACLLWQAADGTNAVLRAEHGVVVGRGQVVPAKSLDAILFAKFLASDRAGSSACPSLSLGDESASETFGASAELGGLAFLKLSERLGFATIATNFFGHSQREGGLSLRRHGGVADPVAVFADVRPATQIVALTVEVGGRSDFVALATLLDQRVDEAENLIIKRTAPFHNVSRSQDACLGSRVAVTNECHSGMTDSSAVFRKSNLGRSIAAFAAGGVN